MTSTIAPEREGARAWRHFIPAQSSRDAEPRVLRVALAGCGAVGSALLRELALREQALSERHGIVVQVGRVLVRDVHRERAVPTPGARFTADVEHFLETDADVLVEAIGGIEPARRLVTEALSRGQHVVTANKELLAAHGTELTALATRHGVTLRHDAAVGGGVPVLRLLDDALGAGVPALVRGILNGTTNYVLCRLEEGCSLEEALADACAAGFAEADASRDLDGRDAAAKIALVAWAAYGVAPERLTVHRRSLAAHTSRFVHLAARAGGVVRQVAECALVPGGVTASVEPVLVPSSHAFATTRAEQNRVEVQSGWSAPLCASGPGAGGVPTATALLSDLLCSGQPSPRNDRAQAATCDSREFDWLVEIAGAATVLHRVVRGCGVVHTDASAEYSWTELGRATRAQLDEILALLTAEGVSPIALRIAGEERA